METEMEIEEHGPETPSRDVGKISHP